MIFLRLRHLSFFLAFLCLACLGNAQQVIEPSVAVEHQISHNPPVYPPIAKAAQVTGVVVLQLTISTTGEVSTVKLVSGPAMLNGSAQEAARRWTYRPFEEDGKATEVTTTIAVPFVLDKQDPTDLIVASAYFPLFDKCRKALQANVDPAEQDTACKMAAAEADKFSPNSRFIERRVAYVYYALALMHDHKFAEAVVASDKAVSVVLLGHDDGSGSSAAYSVRGQARGLDGDLKGSDADLTTAEDFERKALKTPAGKELSPEYKRTLKNLLTFHALVLTRLGETAAASRKMEEAGLL